tara:strand:- start:2888 stop:3391 length:504 start_codon:yes stop_codon:yes gene_type:complete
MAIAADKLRELIRKEVNKNIEKLDHDVDCICEDLRKGKSSGVNIAKTTKFIKDSGIVIQKIEKTIETIKKVRKALEATKKATEASRKAGIISGALNPAGAAIGVALEFVITKAEEEVKDLKSVTNVAPSVIGNYRDFLSRSTSKIARAQLEKELKDSVREDRTNMLS